MSIDTKEPQLVEALVPTKPNELGVTSELTEIGEATPVTPVEKGKSSLDISLSKAVANKRVGYDAPVTDIRQLQNKDSQDGETWGALFGYKRNTQGTPPTN